VNIEYHPAVVGDVTEAVCFYEALSKRLANDFLHEFYQCVDLAASNPERYHQIKLGMHRLNLKRFPYHFIYRRTASGIRITLLRHHRRHPDYGLERA
jgi:hypothetical protein